tara:strand:+ start:466 stop:585 length:120 start_codon:yes stop_codon:yes gene_type:complete
MVIEVSKQYNIGKEESFQKEIDRLELMEKQCNVCYISLD